MTPTLSPAAASNVALAPTVVPLVDGTAYAAPVGAVRSTLIVIGALVVLLPAPSNATLVRVYVPSATASEFQTEIQP